MTAIKVKNVRNLKFNRWDIKEIVINKKRKDFDSLAFLITYTFGDYIPSQKLGEKNSKDFLLFFWYTR